MRNHRWPLVLLALLASALLLGACGDDDEDEAKTGTNRAAVVPDTTKVPRYGADPGATQSPSLADVGALRQLPRATTVTPKVRGSQVPMAQFLDTVSNDVASYWQKVFNNSKLRFPTTTQSVVTGSTGSPCGTISGADGPPIYCQANSTIYLPVGYFENRVNRIGDAATVTLVGLLWGLRVQDAFGAFRAVQNGQRPGLLVQLGAICFDGAYMATVANRNLLESGDVDEILAAARATADQGTPQNVQRAKGTPEQRVQAFRIGFARGPAACQRLRVG